MEEKTVTVNTQELALIHNTLMQLSLSGEDMIAVSKCILLLRQMVDKEDQEGNAE